MLYKTVDLRDLDFTCPCGWQGTGAEARIIPDELLHCPECSEALRRDLRLVQAPKVAYDCLPLIEEED